MAQKALFVVVSGSDKQMIATLTATPKVFKSLSTGFYGQGKIEIDGAKYQVGMTFVLIGSKPTAEKSDDPKEIAK